MPRLLLQKFGGKFVCVYLTPPAAVDAVGNEQGREVRAERIAYAVKGWWLVSRRPTPAHAFRATDAETLSRYHPLRHGVELNKARCELDVVVMSSHIGQLLALRIHGVAALATNIAVIVGPPAGWLHNLSPSPIRRWASRAL